MPRFKIQAEELYPVYYFKDNGEDEIEATDDEYATWIQLEAKYKQAQNEIHRRVERQAQQHNSNGTDNSGNRYELAGEGEDV